MASAGEFVLHPLFLFMCLGFFCAHPSSGGQLFLCFLDERALLIKSPTMN